MGERAGSVSLPLSLSWASGNGADGVKAKLRRSSARPCCRGSAKQDAGVFFQRNPFDISRPASTPEPRRPASARGPTGRRAAFLADCWCEPAAVSPAAFFRGLAVSPPIAPTQHQHTPVCKCAGEGAVCASGSPGGAASGSCCKRAIRRGGRQRRIKDSLTPVKVFMLCSAFWASRAAFRV